VGYADHDDALVIDGLTLAPKAGGVDDEHVGLAGDGVVIAGETRRGVSLCQNVTRRMTSRSVAPSTRIVMVLVRPVLRRRRLAMRGLNTTWEEMQGRGMVTVGATWAVDASIAAQSGRGRVSHDPSSTRVSMVYRSPIGVTHRMSMTGML